MKKIVLIGDSIRMGYDKYVKDALCGVASVVYPDENCRFAEYVLRYAHEWKARGAWGDDIDLVHWNAGLWDVLELFEDDPLTSPEYYGEAIARIDRRLRMLFPRAKMIFATSTPVAERLCSRDFRRHNATIEKYNRIALDALKDTDTVIDDLYATADGCPEEYHSDFVHYYTPEGTKLIGDQVLSVICAALGLTSADVEMKNFQGETYSKKEIGG